MKGECYLTGQLQYGLVDYPGYGAKLVERVKDRVESPWRQLGQHGLMIIEAHLRVSYKPGLLGEKSTRVLSNDDNIYTPMTQ